MRRFRLAPRGGQKGTRPGFRVILHGECALGALEGRFCLPGTCVRIGGRTPTQGVHPSAMEVLGARNGQLPLGSRCLPPPSPKPHVRQSVVARAEDACRVWEGLLSGCSTSDLYQTPQKVISAFWRPRPDLLLEDPVVGRPTPPWAPRRGRRDPDIDSGLARVCFVRIWGRSCVVPTWPSGGVVSSQHRCAPIDDARAGRVWWDRVVALSLGRAQHRPGGRRGDE